jgi:alkylation response protein AidB-like acyl-CoA dehydrogenase
MNLDFDAETEALFSEAGRVFRRVAPVSRRDERGPGTWARLVAAGWGELGAAVESGELDPAVAAGLAREAGRSLLIEQFVSSGYVLAALVAHGPDDARGDWRDRLLRSPGVLLGDGRTGAFDTSGPTSGFCFGVEEPVDAYRLRRDEAGRIHLGISVEPAPHVAHVGDLSPAVGRVTASGSWDEVPTDLDDGDLARIHRGARLVHTAALVGCAERLLEVTRDYVQQRVQFGVAIASFQAVQHGLADVLTGSTIAWSAVLCAAADGGEVESRVRVARYLAIECAHVAATAAAQFHGGIGFTWESDVHWYLKAVLDGGQRFGSRDELATAIGRSFREAAC